MGFSWKIGSFFQIRGEIVFCLLIAVKLCKAMLVGWLVFCGILYRGNHHQAGGNRTKKRRIMPKLPILKRGNI
jgi:hypothetical protein